MSPVHIGTSGWNFRHWRDAFYPKGLPASRWLAHYAENFPTVEVNYSFYHLPTEHTFTTWRDQTPADFCFAVKGSRFVTHIKRLGEPSEHVSLFFERAALLGEKLGPVLWQLPPGFGCDLERLAAFLAVLPPDRDNAFEFRHPSWFVPAVDRLLSQHGAALCLANTNGKDAPAQPRLTANWTYLRFHAGLADGDYTPSQLEDVAARIDRWRREGIKVFAYFNNDARVDAPRNAQTLRSLLHLGERAALQQRFA